MRLLIALLLPLTVAAADDNCLRATAIKVQDADFFVAVAILPNGRPGQGMVRVRGVYAPISTPKAKCRTERRAGRKAAAFAAKWLRGPIELCRPQLDQKNRLHADVINGDGESLADALLDAGLAEPYDGEAIPDFCGDESI